MTSDVDLSVSSLFDVRGKVALVSGGGSGIGYMIASALVQNGAKVYILRRGRRNNFVRSLNLLGVCSRSGYLMWCK